MNIITKLISIPTVLIGSLIQVGCSDVSSESYSIQKYHHSLSTTLTIEEAKSYILSEFDRDEDGKISGPESARLLDHVVNGVYMPSTKAAIAKAFLELNGVSEKASLSK